MTSRGFTLIELLIVLCVVGILGYIMAGATEQYRTSKLHGACVEWRLTGAYTCIGSESYKHCEPDRVCARYEHGATR